VVLVVSREEILQDGADPAQRDVFAVALDVGQQREVVARAGRNGQVVGDIVGAGDEMKTVRESVRD
jgi:hypothetical protein